MQNHPPAHLLEPIILVNSGEVDPLQPWIALDVAVLYEDARTRGWVQHMCGHVAQQIHSEPVRSSWWKIECLGHPLLLEGAVKAAAEADVVIVALYAAPELVPELAVWTDRWMKRRQRADGALVALVGVVEPAGTSPLRTLAYLEDLARRGNLQYISQVRPVGGVAPKNPPLPWLGAPRTGGSGSGRDAGSPDPHESWGINE